MSIEAGATNPIMPFITLLKEMWELSPLLTILASIGGLVWMYIKSLKKEKQHVLSLANLSYLILSFQNLKDQALKLYMQRSLDEVEEMLEEYITQHTCDYRDLIKGIIYTEGYSCKITSPCKKVGGHTLETHYIEIYEKVLHNGFRSVMRDIRLLVANNGFTNREPADFDMYYTSRARSLFEGVIKYQKRHYDDHIMPVPLKQLLNNVDSKEVDRLGIKIFSRVRDHRQVYEDRIKTIEKEENEKMSEFLGGDSGKKDT
ncbi:MAG: hypothetical protein GY941_22115 [Planctomycetes bacterium]|nr:hypothetical protein [Planctomycetota bacterium]